MWGASMCKNALGQFMNANPRVRTLPGLHTKWKQPEPKKELRAATLNDLLKAEGLRARKDDLSYYRTMPSTAFNARPATARSPSSPP